MQSLSSTSRAVFYSLVGLVVVLAGFGAYAYGQASSSSANYQSLLANNSALQDQYQALSSSCANKSLAIAQLQASCDNLTDIVNLKKSVLIDSVKTWVPYHHHQDYTYEIPYAGYLVINFSANKAVVFSIFDENSTYWIDYPQGGVDTQAGQFSVPVIPGNVTVQIRQVIGDMWYIDYNCTYVY